MIKRDCQKKLIINYFNTMVQLCWVKLTYEIKKIGHGPCLFFSQFKNFIVFNLAFLREI